MSANKKAKAKGSRYQRPNLMPETLEDLKCLNFVIGDVPKAPEAEDAWLWEQARTITGKPMHRYLLTAVNAAMREKETLEWLRGTEGFDEEKSLSALFAKAVSEGLKGVCVRAIKRGDSEFFKHLAECILSETKTVVWSPVEQFKNSVLHAYEWARLEMFGSLGAGVPQAQRGKLLESIRPGWLDVRSAMELKRLMPEGFTEKDIEIQRRQIEAAMTKLGLPFSRKRQA